MNALVWKAAHALEKGRLLDGLIAEHIMGWVRVLDDTMDASGVKHGNEVLVPRGFKTLYDYTSNIGYALPNLGRVSLEYFTSGYSERFEEAQYIFRQARESIGIRLFVDSSGAWASDSALISSEFSSATGSTPPLAICRCALIHSTSYAAFVEAQNATS